jgi:hypothetical protein
MKTASYLKKLNESEGVELGLDELKKKYPL